MRTTALSDERVIEVVNANFIPYAINVTCDGFPKEEIPALRFVEHLYNTNWRFAFGFAGCLAIDEEGKIPLGHSSAKTAVSSTSPAFVPSGPTNNSETQLEEYNSSVSFLGFIRDSLARHDQVKSMRATFRQGNLLRGFMEMRDLTSALIADTQKQTADLLKMRQRLNASGFGAGGFRAQ